MFLITLLKNAEEGGHSLRVDLKKKISDRENEEKKIQNTQRMHVPAGILHDWLAEPARKTRGGVLALHSRPIVIGEKAGKS